MDFLKEQGLHFGMSRKNVHCSALADALRREFPEITWVSAGFSGTGLKLEIREGNAEIRKDNVERSCSLFSTLDGVVDFMVTRQGTPLVQPGDEIKKGQELISGIVNITDDSQEIVRYEYVRADADIYIRHTIAYYDTFPVTVKKNIPKGKWKTGYFFQAGNCFLDFSSSAKKNEERLIYREPILDTGNFRFPVSFGIIRIRSYETREETLTEEAAKRLAIQKLHIYEEKLIEKGVQISENNVKIEINHQDCVSRGTLTVIEKTGREAPTEKKTQPKERTPEDG